MLSMDLYLPHRLNRREEKIDHQVKVSDQQQQGEQLEPQTQLRQRRSPVVMEPITSLPKVRPNMMPVLMEAYMAAKSQDTTEQLERTVINALLGRIGVRCCT
jgi:hypothetical protein